MVKQSLIKAIKLILISLLNIAVHTEIKKNRTKSSTSCSQNNIVIVNHQAASIVALEWDWQTF